MKLWIPEARIEPPPPAAPVLACGACGAPIYAGEYYYHLEAGDYCEYCIKDSLRSAEEESGWR